MAAMWIRSVLVFVAVGAVGAGAAVAGCGGKDGGDVRADGALGDAMVSEPDADTRTCACSGATPICNADFTCRACAAANECRALGGGAVCAPDGMCVGCVVVNDCTDPTRPFCDARACRGCQRDVECTSGLCDEGSGRCVSADDIIYVRATGSTQTPCGDRGNECRSIGVAMTQVTAARNKLVVSAGRYPEQFVAATGTVMIVGPGAVIAPPAGSSGPGISVGAGASLTMEGISVVGAAGPAIRCDGSAGAAAVVLSNVTLENNFQLGISATSCDVTVQRSMLRFNLGGGMLLTGSRFTIENTYVTDNGSVAGGGSAVGGIHVVSAGAGASLFRFNTVGGNLCGGAAGAAGVACSAVVTATSSIVYANGGPQLSSDCSFTHSVIEGGAPGTGNLNVDPLFVDFMRGDWHLTATSPARDAANMTGAPAMDFDGDRRPAGNGFDIGADEKP